MNMRLLGARTIKDVVPEMVDASSLSSHFVMTPQDNLFNNTCKRGRNCDVREKIVLMCANFRPATATREVPRCEVVGITRMLLDLFVCYSRWLPWLLLLV